MTFTLDPFAVGFTTGVVTTLVVIIILAVVFGRKK